MELTPSIISSRDGHIAQITIHNPQKRNAMTYRMWHQMADKCSALSADPSVRVVVIRGAGEAAFCAGNDISEFAQWRDDPSKLAEYNRASDCAMRALDSFGVPTIARIDGACVGGGLEIALQADFLIASDRSRFGITPARLGLGYKLEDVRRVVERAGARVARTLLYTGKLVDADAALRLGLLDEVTDARTLDERACALADEIAANAPLTIRAIKCALRQSVLPTAEQDGALVQAMVDACHASDDFKEGQRAFKEKRAPRFSGT